MSFDNTVLSLTLLYLYFFTGFEVLLDIPQCRLVNAKSFPLLGRHVLDEVPDLVIVVLLYRDARHIEF